MTIKYESEDIIPIVIGVLTVINQNLYCFIFKYAVDKHYPDLKPFLKEEQLVISDSSIELLNNKMDDEVIVLVNTYLTDIGKQIDRLSDVCGNDIRNIYKDKRILSMVTDIYDSVVDSPEYMTRSTDSTFNLRCYVDSTLCLLYCLCKLLFFEVLDLTCDLSDDIYNSFYEDSFTFVSVKEEVNEVILFELLLRGNDYNRQLLGLLQN